jgi:hypothetical protein
MTDAAQNHPASLTDRQLADARRDPRLDHGKEAVIADWWAAMGAAERVRTLADWGLQELLDSEAHEKQRLDEDSHIDLAGRDRQASIQAARQRAELARAERDNQLVEHNAMTLISMVGALDAMVENLVPRAREMVIRQQAISLVDRVREKEPEAVAKIGDANLDSVRRAVEQALNERLGDIDSSPRGAGAKRWEAVLQHVCLNAPSECSIPADLDQALTEVISLRHVLAHRAGRVDARALKQAPTLRYADGDLVRVTHADYLIYSAALWTYGQEIIRRLVGNGTTLPPLSNWRQNYTTNA